MQRSTENERPNPEDILRRIAKNRQGRLTVFLGAAAGVGKTYAMLEAAHRNLGEGVDVIIGWIETHGRKETEKLVKGLPRVPAKMLEHRGKALAEMDLDGIIARKPALVLVDELAHSNIDGSRHKRRFQDVEEILKHGINVYTTLNVQHIESLNDIVNKLTGVVVRETVPDHTVEQADKVKLIDIPPEDLIKRLKEGKVYKPAQAEQALVKFFRPDNLSGLRELALRFTANRVEKDLKEYRQENESRDQWAVANRVMVCVGPSPFSAQLIRSAYRLAGRLQTDWLAVNVEKTRPFSQADRERLDRNMRLAAELGAKTLTVVGEDFTKEILEVAHSHRISTIVIGKPRHSRVWEIVRGSIVDELIRKSGDINVYVIRGEAEQEQMTTVSTARPSRTVPLLPFGGGILLMAATTLLGLLLKSRLGMINIALLYQLPVVLSAYWWGRWPAYVTALSSVLVFGFLFEAQSAYFQLHPGYVISSFISFLIIAFVIGGRTQRLKTEAAAARLREKSTQALYQFSLEVASVRGLEAITFVVAKQASIAISRKTMVLIPNKQGKLKVWAEYEPHDRQGKLTFSDPKEAKVAAWAYQYGQVAGNSTETSPEANYLYLPLKVQGKTVGLLGVGVEEHKLTSEEYRLAEAGVGLAALAIERAMTGNTLEEMLNEHRRTEAGDRLSVGSIA